MTVDMHEGVPGPIWFRALMMLIRNVVPICRLGRPPYVHPRPMRARRRGDSDGGLWQACRVILVLIGGSLVEPHDSVSCSLPVPFLR